MVIKFVRKIPGNGEDETSRVFVCGRRPETKRFVRSFAILCPILWCQYLRGWGLFVLLFICLYNLFFLLKQLMKLLPFPLPVPLPNVPNFSTFSDLRELQPCLKNWFLGSRNAGNSVPECSILQISCGSMPPVPPSLCGAKKFHVRYFQIYVRYFKKLSKTLQNEFTNFMY